MNKPFAIRHLSFVILLIGFFLRVHDLGAQSLWLDESYTYDMVVKHDWASVWGAMLYWSNVSPLSYLPLKLSLPFLGTSEFALRFWSAMFGWLGIAATYRLSRSIANKDTALLATALVAFSPFTIWYARDARAYGMFLFFSALSLWAFIRAVRGKGWLPYIITSALLYITHYLSALYVYSLIVYSITQIKKQPLLFRQMILAQIPAAIPAAVWAVAFLSTKQGVAGMAWIPTVTLLTPLRTLWNFFTGDAAEWTLLMTIGVAAIIALIITGMRSGSSATSILTWYLILPIVTAWLFSLRKPSYVDRYFEPAILPVMIFVAIGLMQLPRSFGRYAIALALIGVLFSTSRIYFAPEFAKEDWRGAAKKISVLQLPVAVSEPESPLALSPYISPQYVITQNERDIADLAGRSSYVFVVRSPLDSSHALTKSMPFDALSASPSFFTQWVKANPSVSIQTYFFTGLALIEIRK